MIEIQAEIDRLRCIVAQTQWHEKQDAQIELLCWVLGILDKNAVSQAGSTSEVAEKSGQSAE